MDTIFLTRAEMTRRGRGFESDSMVYRTSFGWDRCEEVLWILKLSLGNAFVKIPSRREYRGFEFLSTEEGIRAHQLLLTYIDKFKRLLLDEIFTFFVFKFSIVLESENA